MTLWRKLMDHLWDGYLIRYLVRSKQDQVDGTAEPRTRGVT